MAEILGITPTTKIPKPIGARIVTVPVATTLTIEERAKRTVSKLNGEPLVVVTTDRAKPRNTFCIIVANSIDPIMAENFKVGMGVYCNGLSGTELHFEGKTFRSLEFNEIISTLEEEEVPESYKTQVRHFLLSPGSTDQVEV